jgi:PAS domain S-box-containing protein
MTDDREDPYRALFDGMSSGVVHLEVLLDEPAPHDLRLLDANPAFARLTGIPDAVGKRASELIPGIRERDGELFARAAEVATSGAPQRFELRVASIDRWLSVSAHRPKPGHVVAVFDVIAEPRLAAEVSERLRVEAELRRLTHEQEVILASANVGIAKLAGRIHLWVNPAMEELLGYEPGEMIGKSTRIYYPSDAAFEEMGRALNATVAQRRALRVEREFVRKDGTRLWVELNARAIDPEDPSKGMLSVFTDRTAARKAADALRRSEARFRNMFEAHSAVMLLVDARDGAIVDANAAAARFYGYERAALRQMNVTQLNRLAPPQVVDRASSAVGAQANTFVFEHQLASGVVRTVEVHSSPIDIDGRRLLFSIVHDVSERIRASAALEALNASLEARVSDAVEALRAKDRVLVAQSRQAAMGEMIGNIAHQWRQPLNALGLVLANVADAARFGELDRPAVDQAVEEGGRLIEGMSRTISDFRDFFRPAKERVAYSARAQIAETLTLIDASFRHAGVALEVAPGADLTLFGFPNEYAQVLLNLLVNARQAIVDRQLTAGKVTLTLAVEGDLARLSVRDNGGGIPEDLLERVFEPYFSTKQGGTGIGLYMSRQIVEQSLGGRIAVRNVAGGAEFDVLTPMAAAAGDA